MNEGTHAPERRLPLMAPEVGADGKPLEIMRGKVTVGWLSPGEVSTGFMISVMQMKECDDALGRHLDHESWFISAQSGGAITRPRNNVVAQFLALRPAPEWFLWLDSDMAFPPTTLEQLLGGADLATGRTLIGGLCLAFGVDRDRAEGHAVIATAFDAAPMAAGHQIAPFVPMRSRELRPNQLVEVYGTGSACILVHRQAFLDVAAMTGQRWCWYRELVIPDTRPDVQWHERNDMYLSEDLFWCHVARQAGHHTYVHTGVEVKHRKGVWLDEQLWRTNPRAVRP